MTKQRSKLKNKDAITFMLAGNIRASIFTILNTKTSNRFTYKVNEKECKFTDKPIWFVKVLTGPDNTSDYEFIGSLRHSDLQGPTYKHSAKTRISETAPSVKALQWTLSMLCRDELPECIEIYHEGNCGKCGLPLTVPESIKAGYGPKCLANLTERF